MSQCIIISTLITYKGEFRLELHLEGKAAIVTGGSAGIGLACAKGLVREGVHVLINGRNRERLDRAIEELQENNRKNTKIIAVQGD